MINRAWLLTDPRRAGGVLRYHTWPHLKPQTVAEHSWNVARILLAIWPEAPTHILREALFHDIGEIASGDAPYPSKKNNPKFGEEHDKLEDSARLAMCLPWRVPPPADLSPEEKVVLKLAHFIEMMEWAYDELTLGNQFAQIVADDCREEARRLILTDLPIPGTVRDLASSYMDRRERQLP